jgi:predicted nucleic acid-binding protein
MKLVVVFDTNVLFSAVDPKDDMVLECALVARATQVVSSDKKHLLSLKQFRGIGMVSPAELIRIVETAALP